MSGSTKFWVWRLPSERYNPATTRATIKHSAKIMVWGCFAANGVGCLHRISGIMDQKVYKNILVHQMKPSAAKLFPQKKFVFQQDNDPKHTARSIKKYFKNQDAAGKFETLPWPSQSPDLNPIENLWAIIENRLKTRKCSTQDQLFQALVDEWNKLETIFCNVSCTACSVGAKQ